MKNKYIKPVFAVELFSTAQTTTRDCWDSIVKEDVTFNDVPNCYWDAGGMKLFLLNTACEVDGEAYGMACYNNPSETQYVFRS